MAKARFAHAGMTRGQIGILLCLLERVADHLARLTHDLGQPGVHGLSGLKRLLLRLGICFCGVAAENPASPSIFISITCKKDADMRDHTFIAKTVHVATGLLVALCLLCAGNSEPRAEGAATHQCQSNSIDESLDDGVMRAYDRFSKPMFHATKARIVEDLKFSLLIADAPNIACMREEIVRRGYLPGFVEMFDEVADWVKRIDTLSGEEIYNLSREIENDPARTRTGKLISGKLMRVAGEKKYPPALRAIAEQNFGEKDKWYAGCRGARALAELAKLGHQDAALELATRFMNGDGVKVNDESALFWFGYAAKLANAGRLDDAAAPLVDRISEEDKYHAGLWIRSGTFPSCISARN